MEFAQAEGQATDPPCIAIMNSPRPSQSPLQTNAAARPAKADWGREALVVFIVSSSITHRDVRRWRLNETAP